MRPGKIRYALPLLIAALLMQACSTAPRVPGSDGARVALYESRAAELAEVSGWTLQGRLAIRNADDGGSGSLRWREGPDGSRMDFHGTLGRGAWRLDADGAGAELELADGSLYRAETVSELVRDQLGWDIPVDALAWWVLGLEAPGDPYSRRLGEDGTLEFLSQDGWDIEFGRYRDFGGVSLPLKLEARQADRTVKLAVRDWELGGRNE